MIFELSDHLDTGGFFILLPKENHMPPRLAVHLHLYYTDMWDEFAVLLQNIGNFSYDLYVTLVQYQPEIEKKIKEFCPAAKIWIVDNRGYDVGPFVDFLHHINLSEYDLIIKLHTKNKSYGADTLINGRYIGRKLWFKLLTQGLLGSRKLFKKNIKAFVKCPGLGMVGSKYLITSDKICSDSVRDEVCTVMERLGRSVPNKINFVAGTMFMCRAHLLQKIKDNFRIQDFDMSDGLVKDGTLAHVLERVFGCLIVADGFRIQGFDKDLPHHADLDFLVNDIRQILRFVYSNKVTNNNYRLVKLLKFPIYHRKLL